MKKTDVSFVISLGMFAVVILLISFAPLFSTSPSEQDVAKRLQGMSAQHPLGTDMFGRDVWSRLLYGGRFSLLLSGVVVVLSACFGTVLGIVAGRLGGWVDELVLRVIDFFNTLPGLAIALVIAALLGPHFWTLVLALCLSAWVPYARLARAVGLELNSKPFMEAAQALGGTEFHLMRQHVLPHTLQPIAATLFLRLGHTLLTIAGLSFLGLGAQPPNADWGLMLSEAMPYMQRVPLLVLAPGLSIFITSLSVTFIGQGLMRRLEAY